MKRYPTSSSPAVLVLFTPCMGFLLYCKSQFAQVVQKEAILKGNSSKF